MCKDSYTSNFIEDENLTKSLVLHNVDDKHGSTWVKAETVKNFVSNSRFAGIKCQNLTFNGVQSSQNFKWQSPHIIFNILIISDQK